MTFELFNIYTTSLIFFVFLFINISKLKTNTTENKPELTYNSRVYFFDFIKGISIIFVILMHVAYFYYNFNQTGNLALFQSYMVKVFRCAIPFFVISSGFLLSLKNFSKKEIFKFYKNKFFRLIIPYFIICLIIYLTGNKSFNFGNLLLMCFNGSLSVPYYFMSLLIQSYILYPFIILAFKKFKPLTILIVSFLISFLSFCFLYKIGNFYFFAPYLIYFVFGIYLKQSLANTNILEIIKSKSVINFNIFIVVLYLLLGLIGLKDHYSNFQFAYSMSLFLILFASKEKFENKFKIISFIGKNSFYIFLTHFFILEFIFNLIKNKFNLEIEFIIFFLLSILFGLILPTLILKLIQKFRVVKKI